MSYQMVTDPVIIQTSLRAPVTKVWKALTDPADLRKWYFSIADFKAEIGFEFVFLAGENQKQYLHVCKIDDVQKNKRLSYTWRYEDYPGISHVSFELIPLGNETKIRLTHCGLSTFPSDVPDFARENFIKGWTEIINNSLKRFVEQ